QSKVKQIQEERRNRASIGVDSFRTPILPLWLTNRLMAGQPWYVDFYDPLQGKFVEESLDESIKRYPPAGGSIAIDGPKVSDVQHETAGHQRCDESKKMGNRYCAGEKICERWHLQQKERRSPVCSTTLPIHRLLNRRDICRHHVST